MGIRDWSSDVCSSDLHNAAAASRACCARAGKRARKRRSSYRFAPWRQDAATEGAGQGCWRPGLWNEADVQGPGCDPLPPARGAARLGSVPGHLELNSSYKDRHAELVSASMAGSFLTSCACFEGRPWTLKQVQGDAC